MPSRSFITVAAIVLLTPASAAAQSSPFAPWDGANPFNCTLQDVGTGTDYPDPDADPFCVKFDKTNQNLTDFGIADFASKEPARVAAASPKCFYFQHDEWTGSIVQGSQPELWHWDGRYFFDKAKGIGGTSVRAFRIGGTPQDATPFVPPEYRPYFDKTGGGGVITTLESGPDPSCVAKADGEEERETVYSNQPDFGDCVPPGGKIRKRKVGRVRLGAEREEVQAKVGPPQASGGKRDRWCVIGDGKLSVTYEDGRADSIRTTTPGHTIRGVGPGARTQELERAGFVPESETRLWVLPRRKFGRFVVARVKRGSVRWMAMVPG